MKIMSLTQALVVIVVSFSFNIEMTEKLVWMLIATLMIVQLKTIREKGTKTKALVSATVIVQVLMVITIEIGVLAQGVHLEYIITVLLLSFVSVLYVDKKA